ncbi:MAG: ROK family protein [Planctomycetaceae bacterium]
MAGTVAAGPYYLGIDVGGTNIKAGVVTAAGVPLTGAVKVKTQADKGPEVGLDNIEAAARQAVEAAGLELTELHAIGLATPGPMDIKRGMLLAPANLPQWHDLHVRDETARRLGKPTLLQNDANAASYGEFWIGAAKDAGSLVFWTLGTGIGCGIIYDGEIIDGAHSHGSECGHIIIDMDGPRVHPGTGQRGTLEAYASARAVVARCKEALAAGRKSSIADRIAAGDKLTPKLIAEEGEKGDELSDEIVMETARYLGIGTVTLMHTIDPEMVLLGGAMTFGQNDTALGRRFLKRLQDEVQARAFPACYENTLIDFATLGGDAGFIGAAGFARKAFRP